ncbi:MAG: endonuclease MutS2 [Desulfovibrionaceae bacterium]
MDQRTLQLLELPKVLARLAAGAVSEPGQAACLAARPLADPAGAPVATAGASSHVYEAVNRANALLRQAMAWRAEQGFSLTPFPSLDGLISFVASRSGALDLDALFALKQVLQLARAAVGAFAEDPDRAAMRWPDLVAMLDGAPWPAKTWSALVRCINADGLLKDESSPELMSVRQQIRHIHQTCSRKVKDFVAEGNLTHYLQDDFMTISSDRYVLPLKSNFKGRLQGIIHDYSQTGETCYFEPFFLVEMNNSLQELKQEEREAERAVLRFLSELVREERDTVAAVYRLLVDLDVLLAKVALAAAMDGRPLDMTEGAPLRLMEARHPLLALAGQDEGGAARQGRRGEARPLDIALREGQRALIISGGNAGGKTVALKTLGLAVLMALSGLPVPVAEGSSLPPVARVFVSLGDEQSLEDHVSTYTAQIRHLASTWERIDAATLVLLDEFGAGTDPSQGAALAQAVVDKLLERGALVGAATHFPALKVYALNNDAVRAASVLFDPASKKPLYKLGYDQVGASQALDVAREHGLPEEILERAHSYLLLDGADTSGLMDRLNGLAVERERENAALATERARLRDKRLKLDERFERERSKLLDEIRGQAQSVLRQWQQQRISQKKAMKELAQVRERLAAEGRTKPDAKPVEPLTLQKGDRLLYLPWNKVGVVEEADLKRGQVKLDMSGVSMWARIADVGRSDAPAKPVAGVARANVAARSAGMVLDLRGQRADVALGEVEKFIDAAILGNFGELEIVHGRGTGALRREVHAFLKDCPAVEDFSLAPEDRGGDGMTVVTLK